MTGELGGVSLTQIQEEEYLQQKWILHWLTGAIALLSNPALIDDFVLMLFLLEKASKRINITKLPFDAPHTSTGQTYIPPD